MQAMPFIRRLWRRAQHVAPLLILAVCAVFMWPTLQSLDMIQIRAYWCEITLTQWIAAASFTALSFWAVGQYDVIAHRQLDTGMPPEMAWRGGVTAVAVSQILGFAVVTATLVRWRMLRGLGPRFAALITGIVSVGFMLAVLAMTSLAVLLFPVPEGLRPLAALTLVLVVAVAVAGLVINRFRLRGQVIELPSINACIAAMGWAFIDVVAAFCALWILIPEAARPDALVLLPVFCLALSAGLLSGTPGGVGPFELVLISLTVVGAPAQTPEYALLVAIFGFRLVYYAIPAALAVLRLAFNSAPLALWRDPPPPSVSKAPRAQTAVIRQTGGTVEQMGAGHAALWCTGHTMVAMRDPFEAAEHGYFTQLQARAYLRNRVALIYKAGRQTALAARRARWQVLRIADEAVLDLAKYSLDVPKRAGLRHKLRKAARAGLHIRAMTARDLPDLARIDAQWQAMLGRARGGVTGQFCPTYLAGQRVYIAEQGGKVLAFASFHHNAQEWALDLLRHGSDLPDGTLQALVQYAIDIARADHVHCFSLSAVPACPDPSSPLWRGLALRMVSLSSDARLRQFKSGFAPRWSPLYLAAPSRYALIVGALDVTREALWPAPPLPVQPSQVSTSHDLNENYEIASSAAA